MKKVLLVLLFMFLISGCSVNYEVEIGGKTLKENMTLIDNQSDNNEINELMNSYSNVFYYDNYNPYEKNQNQNYTYYNKSIIDNGMGINLKHVFNYQNYSGSAIVNNCFDDFFFGSSGDEYYLDTRKGKFTCFDKYPKLDSVTVKVIVDTEVYENNANQINGKEYIWQFNRNNASSASIFLHFFEPVYSQSEEINVLDPEENDNYSSSDDSYSSNDYTSSSSSDVKSSITNESKTNNNNNNIFPIIIIGIIGIIISFIIFVFFKYRQSNKF